MGTVTVLYFAVTRELAGTTEETFELGVSPVTVRELAEQLEKRHPKLQGKLGRLRFARNEHFVGLDEELKPGDVVALIPPVAGG